MNSTNSSAKTGDHDMDTTSSASASSRSEGEPEKDSTYGSCDSDDAEQRHSKLRDYQRRRTSGDREKFKRILLVLNEETEESRQLVVFTKLCEVLSFCTENSLSSMTADSIISLSCFLLRHDAVPALCQRLMAIKYLDVAEQCLQALEKISWEQPLACLQVGDGCPEFYRFLLNKHSCKIASNMYVSSEIFCVTFTALQCLFNYVFLCSAQIDLLFFFRDLAFT